MKFHLDPARPVDLSVLVDTRLLVQANSGGGKSWCLRRLLEETHGKIQHLVIDPEGEFVTLREHFDYVLAARRGGDTAADPRTARLLAERLLELGVSAILDIYELRAHERVRFVREFLEALVDAPKQLWHPVLVVIDEAHVYCPEKGEAESAGAVIDLTTRGRKRGFCAVLATQRLSKLHKDAAAECNNKIIGRTGLDIDVKRAADELGFGKERWRDLRQLQAGHFFAYGPALSTAVGPLHVGPVVTTHPKAGARLAASAPPPTDKVRALLPKLADLPAEVENRQRTTAELEKEVRRLKEELRRAPAVKVEQVPVPVLDPVVLETFKTAVHNLGKQVATYKEAAETLERGAKALREGAGTTDALGRDMVAALSRAVRNEARGARSPSSPAPAAAARPPRGQPTFAMGPNGPIAEGVTGPRQRILDALAFLESVGVQVGSKVQVALIAGASPKSSSYTNNLGGLRTAGLIDYPSGGEVVLTAAGRAAARAPETPPTVETLHSTLEKMLPAPRWRILEQLVRVYPEGLDKHALADLAGASSQSSSYTNNLGGLRSLGLIDYRGGQVVALPVLFLEAS